MLLLISLAKSLNTKSEVGKNKVSKEYVKRQDPTEIPSLFQHMNTWVHSYEPGKWPSPEGSDAGLDLRLVAIKTVRNKGLLFITKENNNKVWYHLCIF